MPAKGCACRQVAESSRRVCPNCEHVEATAVPFTRSGVEYGVCREHDKPVPILTALSKQHFVDERGYVCCHVCGWVLQDFSAELPIDHSIPRYNPDHYAQLAHKRAGALPTVHGRKGRYALTRVLGDSGRRLLAKDANVLRDADALCSMLDVRGDVKGAVMHAVETFYDGAPRRGVSIEAALIALTEAVVRGFGGTLDTPKALRAFNVSNDQIAHARKSVGTWFATYWKGDKR